MDKEKRAENEARNKIDQLEMRIDDLKKQKTNHESDISALIARKSTLQKENDELSKKIKQAIADALDKETQKLREKMEEVDSLRSMLTKERAEVGGKVKELEERIKENSKLKSSLEKSANDVDAKKKEHGDLIDRAKRILESVKEIIDGKNN